MILKQDVLDIPSSQGQSETLFSIDSENMAHIFEILRSKIYQNPIKAICREISCNGRDAQRKLGKKIPIEIEFCEPNILESVNSQIIFRDFGTGISPEMVQGIYSKYGASDKTDSNDFTGGYGLGSKTPFAYTDTFYVKTIWEDVVYTYALYIDETKLGKIALFDKREVTVDNKFSTEVIIPLKDEDDRRSFREALNNTFTYWDVEEKPVFIGFPQQIELKKPVVTKIGALEKTFNKIKNYFIIDGIEYEVNQGFDKENEKGFLFRFKNGEVKLPGHRDSLHYDRETLELIHQLNEIISANINLYISEELNKCSDKHQAFLAFRGLKAMYGSNRNYVYKGHEFRDFKSSDDFKISSGRIDKKMLDEMKVYGSTDKYTVCLFLPIDKTKKFQKRKKIDEFHEEKGKELVILYPRWKRDDKIYDEDSVQSLIEYKEIVKSELGIDIPHYHSLPSKEKSASRKRRNLDMFLSEKGQHTKYLTVAYDYSKKKYDFNHLPQDAIVLDADCRFIELVKCLGYKCFRPGKSEDIKYVHGFKTLNDFIDEHKEKLTKLAFHYKVSNSRFAAIFDIINFKNKEMFEEVLKYKLTEDELKLYDFPKEIIEPVLNLIQETENEIMENNEILKLINTSYLSKDDLETLKKYIK